MRPDPWFLILMDMIIEEGGAIGSHLSHLKISVSLSLRPSPPPSLTGFWNSLSLHPFIPSPLQVSPESLTTMSVPDMIRGDGAPALCLAAVALNREALERMLATSGVRASAVDDRDFKRSALHCLGTAWVYGDSLRDSYIFALLTDHTHYLDQIMDPLPRCTPLLSHPLPPAFSSMHLFSSFPSSHKDTHLFLSLSLTCAWCAWCPWCAWCAYACTCACGCA